MEKLLPIVICLFIINNYCCARDCDECQEHTLIYETLRCNPIYKNDQDCCPKEYDCPHMHVHPDRTCHLMGRFYKPGDWVERGNVIGDCQDPCFCTENLDFDCPVEYDGCAELWIDDYPKAGCYLKYSLDSCCAVDEICPPFNNVTKCLVDGVEYLEGSQFKPPRNVNCLNCVCNKGFNGRYEPSTCKKINCTLEWKNFQDVDNFCAPFYKNRDSCCPYSWICPSDDQIYIQAMTPPEHPELKCRFGERTMNIGDKIRKNDDKLGKVFCQCRIPPFVTCMGY